MISMKDLKPCPWSRTRLSPTRRGIMGVINYIHDQKDQKEDSILEIGAGYSTWYLYQLNFSFYTAIETFPSVVENVSSKKWDNFKLVQKWEDIPDIPDIPDRKYKWFFLDSHVGGNARNTDRHKALQYAIDHKLLKDDVIIIVHDYNKIKLCNGGLNPHKWCRKFDGWFSFVRNYNVKLIEEINGDEFGVYRIEKENKYANN